MLNSAQSRKSLWIPWFFVGAMGFVVAVNGVLAWLALSTWTGIETEDYYQKGLAYNQNLKGAARQTELGWKVKASLAGISRDRAPGPFRVSATYSDRTGKSVEGLSIRAHLIRPVHEGYDRSTELKPTAPGRYVGRLDVPLPGQWDIRLVAKDAAGNAHQWVKRVQVP